MAILDGKLVATEIEEQISHETADLVAQTGKVPGLGVLLIGNNPAALIYVRTKDRVARRLGFFTKTHQLEQSASPQQIAQKIEQMNQDENLDALLVQLPLPESLDTWDIVRQLDPKKDVDCLHPLNLGLIMLKRGAIYPCTPAAIIKILKHYHVKLSGIDITVVGRSVLVARPIVNILSHFDVNITTCYPQTKDLGSFTCNADLVISMVGKPGLIDASMVKKDAILVDVGLNYLNKKEDLVKYCSEDQVERFDKVGYGVCGDIHKDAYQKASLYTPVPGGIGPMAVTMLMYNTLQLFKQHHNISCEIL